VRTLQSQFCNRRTDCAPDRLGHGKLKVMLPGSGPQNCLLPAFVKFQFTYIYKFNLPKFRLEFTSKGHQIQFTLKFWIYPEIVNLPRYRLSICQCQKVRFTLDDFNLPWKSDLEDFNLPNLPSKISIYLES